MRKNQKRSTSSVEVLEQKDGLQAIRVSGYIFRPDEADKLLKIYQQVKDAPNIVIDLSKADWLTSIGVAAIAQVVIPVIESPDEREIYIVVNEKFKRRYFDERPWAEGRAFETVEEIPNFS